MSYADNWTDEHNNVADLIGRVSYVAGAHPGVDKALDKGMSAVITSSKHHDKGDYRNAHKHLQVAAEHLGTAAALGAAGGADPYYGLAMMPKDIAEGAARSYKYGFLS